MYRIKVLTKSTHLVLVFVRGSTSPELVLFVWAKQKDPKCGTKTDAKNAE